MNREAIYAALFNLLSSVPGITTASRTTRHWDSVSPSEMPALFQAQGKQIPATLTNQPTRWTLGATIRLYVSTDGAASPGAVANPIMDAITALFERPAACGPQTLGGLVIYARIEGDVQTSEGSLGTLEVLEIPIRMLVPNV